MFNIINNYYLGTATEEGGGGGGGSTLTAKNDTGAAISVGDKVWICKDSGDGTLYLRTYANITEGSYTGIAQTSGADGAEITVEAVFPEAYTITLTTSTDNAYLNVG